MSFSSISGGGGGRRLNKWKIHLGFVPGNKNIPADFSQQWSVRFTLMKNILHRINV